MSDSGPAQDPPHGMLLAFFGHKPGDPKPHLPPLEETHAAFDGIRRCSRCGVYEPIATLKGSWGDYYYSFVEHESAVCADSYECVRRSLHGVAGGAA